MKYLPLIFSMVFFTNLNSQNLARQLQKQMWYVKGDIYKGEPFEIYSEKPPNCSGYLNFYKSGELEMFLESTEANFSCFYELQNDSIKLFFSTKMLKSNQTTQVVLFYKLKPLADGNGFESIPIKVGSK